MATEGRATVAEISAWKDTLKAGSMIKTPAGKFKIIECFPFICRTDGGTFTWGELYYINPR